MNTLSFASRFRTAAILAAFSERDAPQERRASTATAAPPAGRQSRLRLRAVARLALGLARRRRRRRLTASALPRGQEVPVEPTIRWVPQRLANGPHAVMSRLLTSHFAFSDAVEPTDPGA